MGEESQSPGNPAAPESSIAPAASTVTPPPNSAAAPKAEAVEAIRKLNEPLLNIQCLQPQTFPVVGIDGRGKEYCCKKSEDQFSQSDYRVAIEYCRQRKQRWLAREQRLLKNAKSRFPDSHFYDVDKMIRSSGITQSGKDAIAAS